MAHLKCVRLELQQEHVKTWTWVKNYHSGRTCYNVTPGYRGMPADDGVSDGELADWRGGEALLSSSGWQKPQAGKLLHQRHPNEAKWGCWGFRSETRGKYTLVMVVFKPTCIYCVWWHRWRDCRWWRPLLWLLGQPWSMELKCWHDYKKTKKKNKERKIQNIPQSWCFIFPALFLYLVT